MKAIVFAAGVGSRLKPFTDYMPKALVEVGGIPVLARAIKAVADTGADAVAVNVHHFASVVAQWLRSMDFGVPVFISDESACLLDTAGGIAEIVRNVPGFDGTEDILLHNADIVHDIDLRHMVEQHRRSHADVTVLVDGRRHSSRAFLFDDAGRLRGWHDTANGVLKGIDAPHPKAFGGIHIISSVVAKDIAGTIAPATPAGITPYYIDNCDRLNVRAFTPEAPYRWHDIGTPEKLLTARESF